MQVYSTIVFFIKRWDVWTSHCPWILESVIHQVGSDHRLSSSSPTDADVFWNSVTAFMPHLSMLVNKYKDYVTNGADVERSTGLYKHMLSARGRSMRRVQIRRSGVFFFFNYRLVAHLVLRKVQSWVHTLLCNNEMIPCWLMIKTWCLLYERFTYTCLASIREDSGRTSHLICLWSLDRYIRMRRRRHAWLKMLNI